MLFHVVLIFLCFAFNTADVVNHLECAEAHSSKDVVVKVEGCTVNDGNCTLYKGRTYFVEICFQPNKDFIRRNDFKVLGVFPEFTVPHGRTLNACRNATLEDGSATCESLGGFYKDYRYCHLSKFYVSSGYPTVCLQVRFKICDKRSKAQLVCAEVPVCLQDAPQVEENENN